MVRTSVGKIMWKKHQSHLSGGTITFSPLHTVKTGIASSDELGNQLSTNSLADKKIHKDVHCPLGNLKVTILH